MNRNALSDINQSEFQPLIWVNFAILLQTHQFICVCMIVCCVSVSVSVCVFCTDV